MQEELLKKALKESGLKMTPNRRELFVTLKDAGRPLLPSEICERLPEINPSSVYRNLDLLSRARMVRVVPRGFRTLYELGEMFIGHHHHIVCEKCGKSVGVASEELERLLFRMAKNAGMVMREHHLELSGICEECRSDFALRCVVKYKRNEIIWQK